MLGLVCLGIQRGQRQQRVRSLDGASGETRQQRRNGLGARGALTLSGADGFACLDAANGLRARNGFGEAQAGRLFQTFVAAEEEGLVRNDGAADRAAELVQLQLLLLVVVLARGIERVVCGCSRRAIP